MMRMLEAGDEPTFVLRRMLIFASEDIGTADPNALAQAVAADQAFARLGMPEGMFALAQCCHYLACAPKSNASYRSFSAAREDIQKHGALPVPLKLRNAPTKAMKSWGYGQGYVYPHEHEDGVAPGESYLPDALADARYYEPKPIGFERELSERLAALRAKKR
jgi:putative ATPase